VTAEQLAAQNIDFRAHRHLAASAQGYVDRIEAIAAEGTVLDQARRDGLHSAIATFDRECGFVLDIARRAGVDFVAIELDSYSLCYALEAGRWEGFVSQLAS
jgi:glycerophosphoryl diester phosphodiesterase